MRKINDKGFSLVELIVVIAILAILIGILAPSLTGYIEKTRASVCTQNMDTVERECLAAKTAAAGVLTGVDVEKIMAEHGALKKDGLVLGNIVSYTGICPSDGVVTIEFLNDSPIYLYCSKHSEDDSIRRCIGGLLSNDEAADFFERNQAVGKCMDSEADFAAASAPGVNRYLRSIGIDPSRSYWKIYQNSYTNKNYDVYWSTDKSDGVRAGDTVTVTKYNAVSGEYTKGTAKMRSNKQDGATYLVIDEKSFAAE